MNNSEHSINTKLGKFYFGWHRSDNYDWWIWGRFEKPQLACKFYNCNQWSGKYNFQGSFPSIFSKEDFMNFLYDLKENNLL